MPDKLTDNEIVNSLKEYIDFREKMGLSYSTIIYIPKLKNVLDLINRLQAEKSNLEIELKAMRGAANSYKAENERLKEEAKTIRAYIHDNGLEWDLLSYSKIKTTDWLIRGISQEQLEQEKIQAWKAEAYKEFVEKANEIIDLIVDLMFDDSVSKCQLPSCHKPSSIPCENEICIQENKEYWHSKLNNLLKELVGE